MDSLINAAARALAAGDPLGALKRIALRDDAPALALRGIAMAQLGDLIRAKGLMRRAARAFGPREAVARARCVVAEAEIAFAARELNWPVKTLDAACAVLDAHGDRINAAHARLLAVRRLILIGHLEAADRLLAILNPTPLPPALRAIHALIQAGLAVRRLEITPARTAIARAKRAASIAAILALTAEVDAAARVLTTPAARLIARGRQRPLLLAEVDVLRKTKSLIVDACRGVVGDGRHSVSLARRPVLFALARALAESWPADTPREVLIARGFGGKQADESHRARLRVEIGRLRAALRGLARINATDRGFVLAVPRGRDVVVLAQPVDEKDAGVLALLSDGQAWSSSALALALGTGQRTVQRALDELALNGKVQSFGRGRARRWTTPPLPGFTTALLLPALPPGG